MKALASSIKKNFFIEHAGDIYQVVKLDHSHVGRGSANLKFKIKSVANGNTLEITTKPDTALEQVSVQSKKMQYLYKDSHFLTFMDPESYEQVQVPATTAEDFINFLKEGEEMFVILHDETPLAVRPPQKVSLIVTESHDAAKGNTATNAKKPVIVETGAEVMVPIFIKKGEHIFINPENGEYLERNTAV